MFKNRTSRKLLPLFAILASIIFWIVDSMIDIYVVGEDETLMESIFILEPVEFWIRGMVVILMVLFGVFARKQLDVQANIADELARYKNDLEMIVVERTKQLAETNLLLQQEIEERKSTEQQLTYLVAVDPLTQLYNRRKFEELLEYEIGKEKRYEYGLSLITCDIDYFKKINDTYGHDVGDSVLIEFAKVLKESVRESDMVARWGGEEFIFLLPNTAADVVENIAEKIRKIIEEHIFEYVGTVTASFGIAHYVQNDSVKTMFKRADKALYIAKENGRNRVELIADM